jgi:hypothetical protein
VTIDQVPLSIHCRDHENKDPTDEQQDKINEHDKARETGFGEDRCLNSGFSALGLVYRNRLFDASNSWSCKGSARGIGNPDVDGLSRSNVASGGEA